MEKIGPYKSGGAGRHGCPKVRRATFGDDSSSYHLNGGVTAVPKSERDCPAALKLALQEWECFPIIRWICAFLNSATSATLVEER